MKKFMPRGAGLAPVWKKIFFITLLLLAAGCQANYTQTPPPAGGSPAPNPGPIACTMDAKLCPDGSYVGRTGPKCEFSACPTVTPEPTTDNSGITGKILIGPTCPVERIPPDPNCADKGYQATVIVKTVGGKKEITRFTSAADGTFKVNLNAGTYLLVPISAQVYPRGSEQTVIVEKNKFTQVTINFDSGIR